MTTHETGTLGLVEAAELLKVHTNTVARLIDTGQIPAAKVGRAWVMLRRDVMRYIERQVMQQTAQRVGASDPIRAGTHVLRMNRDLHKSKQSSPNRG